jgi:hypothetical protein
MLIQDVNRFESLQILSENKKTNTIKVRGLFGEAEAKNGNGRIYPKSILEREVNRLQPQITERRLIGELDHPSEEVVHLANASHLITDLQLEGNKVIGEAEILNTPAGKVLQELIKAGVKMGISSRGTGSLEHDMQEDVYRVQDNLKMITWDMVSDPSCFGAYPTVSEGTITESVNPNTEKKNHYEAEKIYLAMLKKTLRKK